MNTSSQGETPAELVSRGTGVYLIGRLDSFHRLMWLTRRNQNGYNVINIMSRSTPVLREFELLVLLAVLSLADEAYPLAIGEEIERRTNRRASRGAVLIT